MRGIGARQTWRSPCFVGARLGRSTHEFEITLAPATRGFARGLLTQLAHVFTRDTEASPSSSYHGRARHGRTRAQVTPSIPVCPRLQRAFV
jgi:hypothetical protein